MGERTVPDGFYLPDEGERHWRERVNQNWSSVQDKFNGLVSGSGAVWRFGTGVPSNGLGNNGDCYYRTDTNQIYQRAAGSYALKVTISADTTVHEADDTTTPIGKLHINVSEEAHPVHVSPTGDDLNPGRADRPKLTIQAAIDSFGDTSVLRADRVYVHGHHVVSDSITVDHKHVLIEGDGWGTSQAGSRGTQIEWNGIAGEPIILFKGGAFGGGVNGLHLLGSTVHKASAGIQIHADVSDPYPNAHFLFANLYVGPVEGLDDSAAIVGTAILSDGTNTNSDFSGSSGKIISNRNDYGLQLMNANNLSWNVQSLTVFRSGVAAVETHAPVIFGALDTLTNPVDLIVADLARVQIFGYNAEKSGQMANIVDGGYLHVYGGKFQLSASIDPTGTFIDATCVNPAGISLTDFSVTARSDYTGSPTPAVKLGPNAVGKSKYFHGLRLRGFDPAWVDPGATQDIDWRDIWLEGVPGNLYTYQGDPFHIRNFIHGVGVLDTDRYDIPGTVNAIGGYTVKSVRDNAGSVPIVTDTATRGDSSTSLGDTE